MHELTTSMFPRLLLGMIPIFQFDLIAHLFAGLMLITP
jgi:hypothetical protein